MIKTGKINHVAFKKTFSYPTNQNCVKFINSNEQCLQNFHLFQCQEEARRQEFEEKMKQEEEKLMKEEELEQIRQHEEAIKDVNQNIKSLLC